jgi:hypothetical protein
MLRFLLCFGVILCRDGRLFMAEQSREGHHGERKVGELDFVDFVNHTAAMNA